MESKSLASTIAMRLASEPALDSCMHAGLRLEWEQSIAVHLASEQESVVHKELQLDAAQMLVTNIVLYAAALVSAHKMQACLEKHRREPVQDLTHRSMPLCQLGLAVETGSHILVVLKQKAQEAPKSLEQPIGSGHVTIQGEVPSELCQAQPHVFGKAADYVRLLVVRNGMEQRKLRSAIVVSGLAEKPARTPESNMQFAVERWETPG